MRGQWKNNNFLPLRAQSYLDERLGYEPQTNIILTFPPNDFNLQIEDVCLSQFGENVNLWNMSHPFISDSLLLYCAKSS